MTFMIHFHVDGTPVPKGRPRFRSTGKFVQVYSTPKCMEYEEHVKLCSQNAMGTQEPLETPIGVYLYFRLPVPKSHPKKRREACLEGLEKHTVKPDLDNLAKSLLDGMNGVIYKDDRQIVSLHCTKVYSSDPGVSIMVKEELE